MWTVGGTEIDGGTGVGQLRACVGAAGRATPGAGGGTRVGRDSHGAHCRALTVRWSLGPGMTSHDSPTPNTSQAKWVKTTA